MKKYLLIALASLLLPIAALAVPAYPGWRSYTQPDGSVIRIQKFGDEFFHWTTDASGQVVEKGADGFYRPVSESQLNARRAAASIRRTAVNRARRSVAKAGIASGQKHFLVILVQFSDLSFQSSTANADFTALLNEHGYNVNGGTGSARDFYYDNSHGVFEPIFDVYGPVTLNNSKSYYGGNDSNGDDLRPHYAVKEGCEKVNQQYTVDFSDYDNDGDGEVDLVFMYYAGNGEADSDDEDSIWPHQWELRSAGLNLTLDGRTIDKYACTNEIVGVGALSGKMCGIGTACHEFGHAMGLPDFYDTDYETKGEAGGLYDYSTMCGGSYNNEGRTPPYFNIEERIMLGWLESSVIREFPKSGVYTLAGVDNNVAYKSLTDKDGEYFVYECRNKTGWDVGIPEAGLIVYHVDKSDRIIDIGSVSVSAASLWSNWTQYNSINENGSHPCFYVVPAGAQSNLNYNYSKFAFPGSAGATSYTATSWNGVESDVHLNTISYSNNQVTLSVTAPSMTLNYNVIANPSNGVYSAGSQFNLALEASEAQPVESVDWYFDDEPVSGTSVTLTAGTHLVEAHLTLSTGATKIVELTIVAQ